MCFVRTLHINLAWFFRHSFTYFAVFHKILIADFFYFLFCISFINSILNALVPKLLFPEHTRKGARG